MNICTKWGWPAHLWIARTAMTELFAGTIIEPLQRPLWFQMDNQLAACQELIALQAAALISGSMAGMNGGPDGMLMMTSIPASRNRCCSTISRSEPAGPPADGTASIRLPLV